MRVTVTGASGFLGTALVQRLLEEGHRVTELRRTSPTTNLGTQVVIGDISHYESVAKAVQGADLVYHLAGKLYQPDIPAEVFTYTHVTGTSHVLKAVETLTAQALLVYCSTTGVFGNVNELTLPDEDAPHQPTNAYEATKSQAERLVQAVAATGKVQTVIIRPGLVYGPGDKHLLGLFQVIKKGWFRLIGSGNNLFHPIFITDMTNALYLVAHRPAALGRTYNIAGTQPLTFRELCDTIALEVSGRKVPGPVVPFKVAKVVATLLENTPGVGPSKTPLSRSRLEFMTSQRAYNVERATQELGFVAAVDLNEGVRRTVAWYRANHLL